MTRSWARRALAALVLLGLGLGLGLWVGARAALARVEAAGVSWTHLEREGLQWRLSGVRRGPARVAQVLWSPRAPRELTLRGVDVDLLAALEDPDLPAALPSGGSTPTLPAGLTLRVEDLSLRLGDTPLAQGLRGVLVDGEGALTGPEAALRVPGEGGARAELDLRVRSPRPELQGELALTARLTSPPTVAVHAPALVLEHPLLAATPLPLPPLRAELTRAEQGAAGRLWLGELEAALALRCPALDPPTCTLELHVPPQPAAVVLAPFAPLAPELGRAQVQGTLGGTLTLETPSLAWTLSPALEGLRVSGAAAELGRLRHGPFEYRVQARDGSRPLRTTGEGTPGWTPLARVSPHLPAAIVAAEDAGFWGHPGYDFGALLEALADNQAAGEVRRGGSTLTQQLVKNLLLSPERTLARKLRELLLAAELDRALGKARVMELYLNVVEWGPDLWGVSAAADRYFLKRPEALQPHEAAFLAAILPSPRSGYTRWYLSGTTPPKVEQVLQKMAKTGALSPAEAAEWAARPLRFVPPG